MCSDQKPDSWILVFRQTCAQTCRSMSKPSIAGRLKKLTPCAFSKTERRYSRKYGVVSSSSVLEGQRFIISEWWDWRDVDPPPMIKFLSFITVLKDVVFDIYLMIFVLIQICDLWILFQYFRYLHIWYISFWCSFSFIWKVNRNISVWQLMSKAAWSSSCWASWVKKNVLILL